MIRPVLFCLCVHTIHGERLPVDEVELEEAPDLKRTPQGLLQTGAGEARQTSRHRRSTRRLDQHLKSVRTRRHRSKRSFHQQSSNKSSAADLASSQILASQHSVAERFSVLDLTSQATQKATMQRLFGRHLSEVEHISHVRAIAKSNGSHGWDLVTPADGVEADLTPAEKNVGPRYVKLTEDQRNQIKLLEQELDNEQHPNDTGLLAPLAEQPMLMAMAGGIGASVGNTGSINFDRDLIHRMKMQDLGVMCLLMFVYFATLSFSACLAHRQAANRSRVKFYADPRMYINTADQGGEEAFLEAFNQQPKQVQLRVTGYLPVANNFPGSFFWRDGLYAVAFSFALDLTPWVVRGSPDEPTDTDEEDSGEVGVVTEDFKKLQKYLANDTNDLSIVQMQKHIQWKCWDELAMNIKHQIRQSGFEGVLNIDRTEMEEMCVYKNTQWANFMHGKALKVLLALSVVGWVFYVPYMWIRCTYMPVRCSHYINISISDYWQYIAEGLSANGFLAGEAPQMIFPAQLHQESSEEPHSD